MTGPEPSRAPIDLRQPRELGAMFRDGFGLYFREFRTFALIALAVVVPVELIVSGIGLGLFSADYDPTPSLEVTIVPLVARTFVMGPLLTAMCIYVLLDAADGTKPRARSAIQRGLDVFGALLVVMLLVALAFIAGLFLLIVGAIVAAVYLAFSMQAAVVEKSRGADALRRSFELVRGSWWRVFAFALLAYLVTNGLAALTALPFASAAESTGEAVYQLGGSILGTVLFAPPLALIMSLLYFDQRYRKDVLSA